MKEYILTQLAFRLQQIVVINIEERRKDHWQMFTLHVITVSLIYASYRYHHTRVGDLGADGHQRPSLWSLFLLVPLSGRCRLVG